jgi:hypothetical protein
VDDEEGVVTRDCKSRSECEKSGICGRAYEYLDATGACIFPNAPYQDPGCGYYFHYYGSIPTELGCLDYSVNRSDCEVQGGSWLRTATTREECQDYGRGCEEDVLFGFYSNPKIVSEKKPTACSKCGGEMVPLLSWARGTWRETVARPLEWRRRDYVQ